MLKRFAILLLCLIYTASVYGIVVSVRYCGAEPAESISTRSASCPMCHSAKAMKCCKTGHVQVKVKDAHIASDGVHLVKAPCFALTSIYVTGYAPVCKQTIAERIVYYGPHAPPPDSDLMRIKNRVFRI